MRYFHQPIDYWLDHCTLQDWREIYLRELTEMPPAEAFLADYFEYDAPRESQDAQEEGEVVFDTSDCEA